MSDPGFVTVDWAAYGTEANGASAQLLAAPARGISAAEAGALRLRFERVRDQLKTVTTSASAFLPIGDSRWALLRLDQFGPGGRDHVGVLWAAFIDSDVLESKDWIVHALMATALPPVGLPQPGLRCPPHQAALLPVRHETDAMVRACDAVAAAVPDRPALLVPPADVAPSDAVAALWSRLLPEWRRGRSFATWHQLADDAHIIVSPAGEAERPPAAIAALPRLILDRRAPPLALWTEFVRATNGLPFPPRNDTVEEIEAAAKAAAEMLREQRLDPPPLLGNWRQPRSLSGYRRLLDALTRIWIQHTLGGGIAPRQILADLQLMLAENHVAPELLADAAQAIAEHDLVPCLEGRLRNRLAPALLDDDAALLRRRPDQLQRLEHGWDWWLPRIAPWLDANWLALACSWTSDDEQRRQAAVRILNSRDWPSAINHARGPCTATLLTTLAGALRRTPLPQRAGGHGGYLRLRLAARGRAISGSTHGRTLSGSAGGRDSQVSGDTR